MIAYTVRLYATWLMHALPQRLIEMEQQRITNSVLIFRSFPSSRPASGDLFVMTPRNDHIQLIFYSMPLMAAKFHFTAIK